MKTSFTLDLRPMSLGDILDRSIRLYRENFLHTVGIVAAPNIIIFPVAAALGVTVALGGGPRTLLRPGVIAIGGLAVVGIIWLSFLSMGALARSVSERFLGEQPTFWGSYSCVLRKSLSLVWAYLLASLICGGVGILLIVLLVPVSFAVGRALAFLAVPIVIIAIVLIFLRLLLITQVIVIEDVRGKAALHRSWSLMRGNFWRGVLILIFSFIVGILLGLFLQFPISLLASSHPTATFRILETVMKQLANIIAMPLGSIAFTLLYYDSRIRQEAFDLQMMAQDLGVSTASDSSEPTPSVSVSSDVAAPAPPAPPRKPATAPAASPPAAPPRSFGAFKVCPKCGAQVPNIQPNCAACGTRVPFRPAIR